MIKKTDSDRFSLVTTLIFGIYILIHTVCFILTGDDFDWALTENIGAVFDSDAENGRYFSNLLVYFFTKNFLFRVIIGSAVYFAWYIFYNKIFGSGNRVYSCIISAVLILTVPVSISFNTVMWISGFVNYVVGMVIFLSYYVFCLPIFRGENVKKGGIWCLYGLIAGFCGALCVENITLFILIFSVFVFIFYIKKYKKIFTVNIFYFIGIICGIAVMLTNSHYSSIFMHGKDDSGIRSVETSFMDIVMKIYTQIIPYYVKPFVAVNFIIAVSLSILYFKKYTTDKKPKYSKICICIVYLFAFYSVFTSYTADLFSFTTAHRAEAIETAFTFMYIISLIYLFYLLTDRNTFTRLVIYVVSSLIVTAPFLIVNPVTPRCFFASFVFWTLTAGEISVYLLNNIQISLKFDSMIKHTGILTVSFFCFMYSYINVSNKYTDIVRINYIKEQISENSRSINLIKLPYSQYVADYIRLLSADGDDILSIDDEKEYIDYPKIICRYYNIDDSLLEKQKTEISMPDYYLSKE